MPTWPNEFPDELFGGGPTTPGAPPPEDPTQYPDALLAEEDEVASHDPAARAAIEELQRIEAALQEARAASDVTLARRLRDRWNELNTVWGLDVDAGLLARAEPVLRWLRQQEKQQSPGHPPMPPAGGKAAPKTKGLAELQEVQTALEEARSNSDVAGARVLRDRWNELNTVWGLDVDDSLIEAAEPSLQWLREQDAREERRAVAAAALELALEAEEPLEKIRPLYRAAVREGELEPALEARYRRYSTGLERAITKQTRLAIAGVVAGGLLIVAMITGMIVYKVYNSRVQAAAKKMEKLLDEDELQEAKTFLDELQTEHPRVARGRAIQDLELRLEKLLKEDSDRHEKFLKAVAVVRTAVDGGEFDNGVTEALAQARKLQKTEEEKGQLLALQEDIRATGAAGQEMLERQFRTQVKEFSERLRGVEAAYKQDRAASRPKVAEALFELRTLEGQAVSIGQTALAEVKPLRARLEKLDAGTQGAVEQESWEERLRVACGDVKEYRKELEAYIERFPDTEHSASFKQVLGESRLWDSVERWNVLIKATRQERFDRIRRKTAARCLEQLKTLLADYGDHPDAEAFRSRMPYLEAVARRDESGKPIEAALKAVFAEPLMKDAWLLVDTHGLRYYLLKDPGIRPDELKASKVHGLTYLAGADKSEKQKMLQTRDVVSVGPAPHTLLAANVRMALETLSDDSWEKTFTGIMQLIVSDPQTDPILKLNLLRKVLPVACQGSLPLSKALARHLEVLQKAEVSDTANWIDPDDTNADAARKLASEALNAFADVTAIGRAAVLEVTLLHPEVGTEYQWVGWLHRKPDDAWSCHLRSLPATFGTLVVLRASGDKMTIAPVGRLSEATATIDVKPSPALVEGRPVFLAVPPQL